MRIDGLHKQAILRPLPLDELVRLYQDHRLAIGDGALGLWAVLNAMPKPAQAKAHLHDIWQAQSKAKANVAFNFFVETSGAKWDRAASSPVKDREARLNFRDVPAEHSRNISGRQIRSNSFSE